MLSHQVILFIVFNVVVFIMLFLDLKVFQKKAHKVGMKEAAVWSVIWIGLALLFNLFVWYDLGHQKALEYFTGYLIEKSLSVDNLFVFIMIFSYFSVPAMYHHRVLYWGILGALVMRGIFIASGLFLIQKFHFVIYVFGLFLIFTGIRMFFVVEKKIHPERNIFVRLLKKFLPVWNQYEGEKFFIRNAGKIFATPLLIVLVVIETTDVVFAVDSIPAIFAITRDPLIVYTSNIFAILGLRALYFLLANMMDRFVYLKYGLAVVLTIVGIKMTISDFVKIPILYSLGTIAFVLAASVTASLLHKPGKIEN
jgi:tellurite resistance protein TerC